MSEILCSTGALIGRPNGRNYRLLAPLSEKLNCDGFEFMMYETWYEQVEELTEFLCSLGIRFQVMHCEKHIGEAISRNENGSMDEAVKHFEQNCGIAVRIGAKKMVVHLWDGLTSDSHFSNNIKAYKTLAEIASSYGIDLLVENVVCNQENPMKHWKELAAEYPDIHFIYDTKMAAFHGQMDLIYEKEYQWLFDEHHIRHYHVNDYAGGYMEWGKLKTLPIGAGNVNFNKFFSFLQKQHYNGTFTVEATAFGQDGTVDTEMLNRCFEIIRQKMGE